MRVTEEEEMRRSRANRWLPHRADPICALFTGLVVFATVWLLLMPANALANEGFSISLGVGPGLWDMNDRSLSASLGDADDELSDDSGLLSSAVSSGVAMRFAMMYTIMGYASVELGLTTQGWNLFGGGIGGSGHASGCAHFHPLHLWLPRRDYDATLFLGGGYSFVGGGQSDNDDARALSGPAAETGLTARYYLAKWFAMGADFRVTIPFYDIWYADWTDETYDLGLAPDSYFYSALLVMTFQFVPGEDSRSAGHHL